MASAVAASSSLPLSSGHSIPRVGFGTWRAAPGETADSVYTAVKSGYKLIDCAKIYANETEVGQGLKRALDEKLAKREELFVVTKVWNDSHSRELCTSSVDVSLKDLQLDYLDLVLIHWPVNFKPNEKDAKGNSIPIADSDDISIRATWEALEALVAANKVRSIGVSNFSAKQIDELLTYAKIKPAVNQVELHPYFQQEEMLAYAKKNNLVVMQYSPLGNLKREGAEDVTPLNEPVVARIAEAHKVTPAQVVLRWGLQHGHVVLPKSVTPERIRANIALDFELSAEEMEQIKQLGQKNKRFVNPPFAVGGLVFP